MKLFKHKKVELTELFFDLVFVFAISRLTHVLGHLHHGFIAMDEYLKYIIMFLALIATWTLETTFVNRYGNNGIMSRGAIFANMFFLMIFSVEITAKWEESFVPATLGLMLYIMTTMFQFLYVRIKNKNLTENDKYVANIFIAMTAMMVTLFIIGLIIGYKYGNYLAIIATILAWIIPLIYIKRISKVPMNFGHLLERMTLLTIVFFGETVVTISLFFKFKNIDFDTVFVFLIMVGMFYLYITYYDDLIEINQATSGMHLIYTHVLIFISIAGLTVGIGFLHSSVKINNLFRVTFLVINMFIFILGLHVGSRYIKGYFKLDFKYYILTASIWMTAFALMFLFNNSRFIVSFILTSAIILQIINVKFQTIFDKMEHSRLQEKQKNEK
ncbi:low temperature requirement protein A [Mycoplasmopsis gallopavonis]|uniref:Predicted membrane protein n=1 Tax=Mycoplasmopsis gallopavonis TaxID=76629 RepID=A0A449AYZ2_9BACT|nr:low temperature requirement protein A [Mycoplasmopsis gallopavonis]RIV16387.1 low temperature requirement protein A [Mycoplasmopsis gallopavonis]VEU72769.1 Predicted membrane protein [Mycoplasmopsis gallopavonis]